MFFSHFGVNILPSDTFSNYSKKKYVKDIQFPTRGIGQGMELMLDGNLEIGAHVSVRSKLCYLIGLRRLIR